MSYIAFTLLMIAVLGLWLHRNIWIAALSLSIVVAYFSGALQDLAALWIAVLAALAFFSRSAREREGKALQLFAAALLFVFALALGLLLLPGFPRTVLVEPVVLSPGGAPYGIGVGFPKVVAGILILGLVNTARIRSVDELLATLRSAARARSNAGNSRPSFRSP
jgi:hypothetical protein